ncbi:MAG: hypothetical protein CME06_08845 [Gemmatimonadetes bacterium]|nr:hypothetical protein [Gemmatimonadota bacterium]
MAFPSISAPFPAGVSGRVPSLGVLGHAIIFAGVMNATGAHAATNRVPGDYPRIQYAIDAAS